MISHDPIDLILTLIQSVFVPHTETCSEGLVVGLWVKEVLVERLVARWGVKLELRGLLWLESWLLWLLVLVSWAGWGNLLGLVINPLGSLLPMLVHPVEGWWGSLERLMIGWILAL